MRFRPEDLDRTSWQVRIRGTKTNGAAKTLGIPECMRPILDGVRGPFAAWAGVNASLERACRRVQLRLAAEVEAEGGAFTPPFPRVTPNDVRRSFASLLVQGGAPLDIVARLMRHASTAMVYRTYGQHTPESLSRLAAPLKESDAPLPVPPVYQTERNQSANEDTAESLDPTSDGLSGFRFLDIDGVDRRDASSALSLLKAF